MYFKLNNYILTYFKLNNYILMYFKLMNNYISMQS